MKLWAVLICCFSLLSAENYPYRDLNKPPMRLSDDINIIQISPSRTGSTLIYNVLKYLFEDKKPGAFDLGARVVKTHSVADFSRSDQAGKRLVICKTIRDPMNIAASRKLAGIPFKLRSVIDQTAHVDLSRFPIITIITFRYEDFENDHFEKIFETLEKGLGLKIPNEARRNVEKHFCRSSVLQIQNKMGEFNEFDHITNVHGKHISDSDWRKHLSFDEAIEVYNLNYEIRLKWGYGPLNVNDIWHRFRRNTL